MPEYEEPRPPKPSLLGKEQDSIIDAALDVLNAEVLAICPCPGDSITNRELMRLAIYDSLKDNYAVDAIPRLLFDMSQAALARLHEISAEREANGGVPE
ncbi:hypothetical protein [Sphingomonas sp.]|uniref:hypothetical protein n=1 Tax=Sphingomonas sp. TaxID=28214 RepID=UPI003F706F0B